MKINLFFFLARFGLGGAGNSVYRLCNSLNKKKFNINVICLNECAYESKFKKKGIKVFKIKSNRTFFSIFKINKLLKKIIDNKSKNIFVSNINYTNILCALFLNKDLNLKLIAIERTPFKELEIYFGIIDYIKKNIIKNLIHLYYYRFNKIICNSKYLGNYLKNKFGYDFFVIYPPSIISNKKIIFKKKYNLPKIVQISTICRLSKEKSIQKILYAINYLNINKNIKFNIIGDGPEKKFLKNLSKKLHLDKNVKFYGHQNNIEKFLLKTDLYINSSHFEGFPNSVAEAVNFGIPVICSQSHGGINEILMNGKAGTIFHSDYKNLANEIKKFLNNPDNFYKKAKIAKKNISKFSLENHKINFENLINKL